MKQQTSKSRSADYSSRCRHYTVAGRRCRLRVLDSPSGLCFRHLQLQEARSETLSLRPDSSIENDAAGDLSAILTAGLTEFKSAVPINDFLSRLLLYQAQDRIPPRRAAVMAYTCSLLLRTLPAIEHELNPQPSEDAAVPNIIIDLPRPNREPIVQSS